MSVPTPETVDTYFEQALLPEDPHLDAARARSQQMGLVPHAVSPLQGAFLQILLKSVQAKRILEIGTLGGYAAIWMAKALPPGGQLITLEIVPAVRAVALQNIEEAGLSDVIDVRLGPAIDSLDGLIASHEAPFDFIFIDADKSNNPAYWSRALKLSRTGTVIVIDNVVREGRTADETNANEHLIGVRQVLQDVRNTAGVTATALQTVGSKGWDGFAMAVIDDHATALASLNL